MTDRQGGLGRGPRCTRRTWTRGAIGSLPALALGGCADDEGPRAVATVAELEAGEIVDFEHPTAGACFVVALESPAQDGVGPNGSIVAFTTACPHMGCPIASGNVDRERGEFGPCACHQSLFDLTRGGRLVRGRATENLARIDLEVHGEDVVVAGVDGLPYGQPLDEASVLNPVEDGEEA